MAILIGSGGAGESALDVAHRVLSAQPSLRRLASLPGGALEREPGIGKATAARIQAALELGRRAAAEPSEADGRIRGPGDVFARMGPLLRDLQQEEFHALLLNTQHRVLRDVLVTRGILDASVIHPREVFRAAIVEGAAGVILVHNHPSGDPTPSREDRAVTRQLRAAGRAIGIPVLDHVVLGGHGYVSLGEELR
jgi:DNA repair protein RadC